MIYDLLKLIREEKHTSAALIKTVRRRKLEIRFSDGKAKQQSVLGSGKEKSLEQIKAALCLLWSTRGLSCVKVCVRLCFGVGLCISNTAALPVFGGKSLSEACCP